MIKQKVVMFFVIMFLVASCSSDDDIVLSEKEVENPIPIPSKLELRFVRASGDSDISNLQVGDSVIVGYKITGENLQEDEAFAITPLSGGPVSHQVLGEDYDCYYRKQKVESFHTSDQEGEFTLHIKKPGNFRHVYELSKVKKDSLILPAQQLAKGEIFFNSVRIVAYSYEVRTKKGDISSHSRWDTYYKYFIDSGNEQYDTYLEGLNSQFHYNNLISNQSDFQNKTSRDFHPVQRSKGSGGKYRVYMIDKIMFKKQVNGLETNIEYKNIPVGWYDRQDQWGDRGTENL